MNTILFKPKDTQIHKGHTNTQRAHKYTKGAQINKGHTNKQRTHKYTKDAQIHKGPKGRTEGTNEQLWLYFVSCTKAGVQNSSSVPPLLYKA